MKRLTIDISEEIYRKLLKKAQAQFEDRSTQDMSWAQLTPLEQKWFATKYLENQIIFKYEDKINV